MSRQVLGSNSRGFVKSLAVVCDYPQENWTSMDLVGQMFYDQAVADHSDRYRVEKIVGPWKWRFAPLPAFRRCKPLFNADRMLNRHIVYPSYLKTLAKSYDYFHVVDHSYAMVVHALPQGSTGVFCHDLDAFRSILEPDVERRPGWYRYQAKRTLEGLKKAAVVFYTTESVRSQIEHHHVLDPKRLVKAPYGVGKYFKPDGPTPPMPVLPDALAGRPFLLHVGTCITRKRIDVLLEVFAAVRKAEPDLFLLQVGGTWQPWQQELIDRLSIRDSVCQVGRQPQDVIAEFIRRSSLVLLPSEREGFGLPVAETLACGAVLVASDIPVLREVGGNAAVYAPLADIEQWATTIVAIKRGERAAPPKEDRLAVASQYTWKNHAATILNAYENLGS